ncbi:MAG: hypothetical protein ACE366_08355 [Bradymonadia bacterium]
MRRLMLSLSLSVPLSISVSLSAFADESAETPPTEAPTSEDDPRPIVNSARAAYNEGRYQAASRDFQEAVQAYPKEAPLYRDLARARMYAKNPAGAVVAYRLYIQLAPDADDLEKVQAESELAARQAGDAGKDPLAGPRRTFKSALDKGRVGRFAGPDGAFKAMDDALEAGFIGPEIHAARRELAGFLKQQSDAALDRWWRPEAQAPAAMLQALVSGWKAQKERRKLTGVEAGRASAMVGLLELSKGQHQRAFDALSPVAPSDARIRYAQALALARLDRHDEASAILLALTRQLDDPQVWWLLGWTQRASDQDAKGALKRALGL